MNHLTAFASGTSFLGAGLAIIAQSILDPSADVVERLIGGSIIGGASILVIRWVRQTAKDAASSSQLIIDQYQDQVKELLARVGELNGQLLVAQQTLAAERDKRWGSGPGGTPI